MLFFMFMFATDIFPWIMIAKSKAYVWFSISDYNRNLGSNLHHFKASKEVKNHPTLYWEPIEETTFKFHHQVYSWDILLVKTAWFCL